MGGGIAVVKAEIWWEESVLRQEWRYRCPEPWMQLY